VTVGILRVQVRLDRLGDFPVELHRIASDRLGRELFEFLTGWFGAVLPGTLRCQADHIRLGKTR
jgi:hypothetical protein